MRNFILSAVVAFMLSSCNGDIFIDRTDLPFKTSVTVDGDGGHWQSYFSRSGLEEIELLVPYDDRQYINYYDTDGKEVDENCPASQLGAIIFENPTAYYKFNFNDNTISFESCYNAGPNPVDVCLNLYFGYGTKRVDIDVTKGKPLSVFFWNYDNEVTVTENIEEITRPFRFTNNSDAPVMINYSPYSNYKGVSKIETEQAWAVGLDLEEIPLVEYSYGDWTLGLVTKNVIVGEIYYTEIRNTDISIVKVPANATVNLTCTVRMSRAVRRGSATMINQMTNDESTFDFECISVYPTSYELKTETENAN